MKVCGAGSESAEKEGVRLRKGLERYCAVNVIVLSVLWFSMGNEEGEMV